MDWPILHLVCGDPRDFLVRHGPDATAVISNDRPWIDQTFAASEGSNLPIPQSIQACASTHPEVPFPILEHVRNEITAKPGAAIHFCHLSGVRTKQPGRRCYPQ